MTLVCAFLIHCCLGHWLVANSVVTDGLWIQVLHVRATRLGLRFLSEKQMTHIAGQLDCEPYRLSLLPPRRPGVRLLP